MNSSSSLKQLCTEDLRKVVSMLPESSYCLVLRQMDKADAEIVAISRQIAELQAKLAVARENRAAGKDAAIAYVEKSWTDAEISGAIYRATSLHGSWQLAAHVQMHNGVAV